MKRKQLLLLILTILSHFVVAQVHYTTDNDHSDFQFGASAKLTIGFEFREHRYAPPVYRLTLDGGVMYTIGNVFSPSYNLEIQLYNGGLASSAYGKQRHKTTVDFINAFTITGGTDYLLKKSRAEFIPGNRVPFYYFADFVYPALINPYHFSASFGTNLVFSTDKGKSSQRVGFINLHQGRFQFSYYNDGGYGMNELQLGDHYDRYYTGGGILSYSLNPENHYINLIELGFHKFSGFTENAFDLSNLAGLAFVNYSDSSQQYYNKGCYSLHLANLNTGFGLTIKRENDYANDFQSLIHYVIYDAYHQMPYPASYSINADFSTARQQLNLK